MIAFVYVPSILALAYLAEQPRWWTRALSVVGAALFIAFVCVTGRGA